jgi:hypothetical protein
MLNFHKTKVVFATNFKTAVPCSMSGAEASIPTVAARFDSAQRAEFIVRRVFPELRKCEIGEYHAGVRVPMITGPPFYLSRESFGKILN